MSEFPDTRYSLLARVTDPQDRDAWNQFADVYRPVIFRIARARGLQDADANDLAQQVLMSVASAITRWEKSGGTVRFRNWLSRVTRNAILNAMSRGPTELAIGGDSVQAWIVEIPASDDATESLIETEYRRELYLRAADIVRDEVTPSTWKAFELTVMRSVPIEDAARELSKSVGAIYSSRSRIMFRLRQLVSELEARDQ